MHNKALQPNFLPPGFGSFHRGFRRGKKSGELVR